MSIDSVSMPVPNASPTITDGFLKIRQTFLDHKDGHKELIANLSKILSSLGLSAHLVQILDKLQVLEQKTGELSDTITKQFDEVKEGLESMEAVSKHYKDFLEHCSRMRNGFTLEDLVPLLLFVVFGMIYCLVVFGVWNKT